MADSTIHVVHILLVRHAQTAANVEKWISGWRNDVDLTHQGVDQAYELGRKLKQKFFPDTDQSDNPEPPVGILCSDLLRARRTATIVNTILNLPIEHHPGLRERNYGEWTGRQYQDLGRDPKDWENAIDDPNRPLWTDEEWAPPGGETLITFRERAIDAIRFGMQRWKGKKFLVIAHRGTIRALLQHHLGVAYHETPSPPNPPEFMEIEWDHRSE